MIANFIDRLSALTGKVLSYLILPLIGVITYAVFMRYVIKKPPEWSFEMSLFIFGSYMLLGGAYCLLEDAHVNVDVLPKRLPLMGQNLIKLLSNAVIIFVTLIFVRLGTTSAIRSTQILERSIHQTNFNPPIWWFRWIIPISAFLILLQACANTIRIFKSFSGKEKQL